MQAPSESANAFSRFFRRGGDRARGASAQAFELKGMVAPLTVLRLRSTDVPLIERQLRAKVGEMPQFFKDAPVLLDLGALGPAASGLAFADVAAVLRSCQMVPVAITNAEDDARSRASAAGFGYVAPSVPRTQGRSAATAPAANVETAEAASSRPAGAPAPAAAPGEPAPTTAATSEQADSSRPTPREMPAVAAATPDARASGSSAARATESASSRERSPAATAGPAAAPRLLTHRPPVIIRQPVRSGQIIYAEATDLVILAPVNPGAEVIADGHVHIYSTLRGRAVAGAQGLTEARIFCQKLEAELVAISGAYLLSDDLPSDRRGKPAQIHLEDGVCRVVSL